MAAGNTVHADGPNDPLPMKVKTADLPRRLASAAAMLVVTVLAVGIGGAVLDAFIALVALVAFGEFALLVVRATPNLGLRLAAWLEQSGKVSRVYYPGLASHPDHAIAKRQMSGGFGGMCCFGGHRPSPYPTRNPRGKTGSNRGLEQGAPACQRRVRARRARSRANRGAPPPPCPIRHRASSAS